MIRFVLICTVIITVILNEAVSRDTITVQISRECMQIVNATEEERLASMVLFRGIPKTRGSKCILACIMKKQGTIDTNNRLDGKGFELFFTQELGMEFQDEDEGKTFRLMAEISDTCNRQVPVIEDSCEAASSLMDCLITEYFKNFNKYYKKSKQ